MSRPRLLANKCSRCGNKTQLEIHHIKHRVDGGGNEPENLTVLCRGCHDYQHSKEDILSHIRKCENKHQFSRLKIWQYRLDRLEEFNKPEIIKENGFKSYWEDVKTHYMSEEVKVFQPPKEQLSMPMQAVLANKE